MLISFNLSFTCISLISHFSQTLIGHFLHSRYFDDDDEPQASSLEYIPAPGSPSYERFKKPGKKQDSDSEEDPLDAFMAGIDAEVKRNTSKAQTSDESKPEEKPKGFRADIDGEDDEESYYRYKHLE